MRLAYQAGLIDQDRGILRCAITVQRSWKNMNWWWKRENGSTFLRHDCQKPRIIKVSFILNSFLIYHLQSWFTTCIHWPRIARCFVSAIFSQYCLLWSVGISPLAVPLKNRASSLQSLEAWWSLKDTLPPLCKTWR